MANPFTHAPRGSMSAQRVARIFVMRDGRCGVPARDEDGIALHWGDGCGWKFGVKGDYEIDHILALERGGTDDDSNLQLLCAACHSKKTPDDHATAGRMRRSFTVMVVPKRFRKGKGWR